MIGVATELGKENGTTDKEVQVIGQSLELHECTELLRSQSYENGAEYRLSCITFENRAEEIWQALHEWGTPTPPS